MSSLSPDQTINQSPHLLVKIWRAAYPAAYTGEAAFAALVEAKQRHGARGSSAEVLGFEGILRDERRMADCRDVARGILATVRAACLVSRENMAGSRRFMGCSNLRATWEFSERRNRDCELYLQPPKGRYLYFPGACDSWSEVAEPCAVVSDGNNRKIRSSYIYRG